MRALFLILAIPVLGYSLQAGAQTPPGPKSAAKQATAGKKGASDAGEQKFKENCGRCHNAPDSLSPREVKAVMQHMRVRAMLSAEDEQLILKYLAP